MPTARFLRSFSEDPNRYSPPFSSISSSTSSYFSSSSYANSITLPAAPVFGGSSFSSIKKKKRSLLRASIASACSDLFQTPESNTDTSSSNMMMVASSPSSNELASINKANNRKSTSSDIELATEIGQGLLSEVRRMQSVLQERQETLIQLEHEKTDHQQRIVDLIKQLRFKNETEERLKEDIWNLELTKQDLSHQIRQLSANIHKTHMEQVRRERQESLVHQELELLKAAQLKWQEKMTRTQNDYETKLATLHKTLLKLKREKEAISVQLEQLQKQTAAHLTKEDATMNLRRKSSEKEFQALQASLAEAHHVMESLQLDLENEKQKKSEVEALLRESQETIEQMQQQKADVDADAAEQWCQQDNAASVHTNASPVSAVTSLEEELLNVERRQTEAEELERYGSMLMNHHEPYYHSAEQDTPVHPLALPHHVGHMEGFEKVLPFVMHTMIGEWLLKYTRFKVKSGISDNAHKRFFWLHPYTKTLYWSQQEPGVQGGEYKAKSVSIESFYVDQQQNEGSPLIVVKSHTRDIKLQCTSKESHEKWVQSLNCLFKEEEKQDKPVRNKRLSLLLETAPPATIKQKKSWRMSVANIEEHQPQTQPEQRKPRPHSMIKFASLRIKSSLGQHVEYFVKNREFIDLKKSIHIYGSTTMPSGLGSDSCC
ncbi:meiotic cell cortex C-terminal pleckstrin homology-domain-containing protein [Mucor lusitanicus]